MKFATPTICRIALVLLVALAPPVGAAETGPAASPARRMQTLHAPWFFIASDFHAIIAVKNCTSRDIVTQLTVRFGSDAATDGTYEVPGGLAVAAGRVALVDLRQIHDAAPDVFGTARSGGLELTYIGDDDDLLATVTMTSTDSHLSFDVPFSNPRQARSNRLDGSWWFTGTDYEAFVEIKNTTDEPVEATLSFTFGETGKAERVYLIPARQARAVSVGDVEDLKGATWGSAEIVHTGRPGALVAQITTLSTATGISHGGPFRARALASP